jgi:hypothetical protein
MYMYINVGTHAMKIYIYKYMYIYTCIYNYACMLICKEEYTRIVGMLISIEIYVYVLCILCIHACICINI